METMTARTGTTTITIRRRTMPITNTGEITQTTTKATGITEVTIIIHGVNKVEETEETRTIAVSYTHLDVYKRQISVCIDFFLWQTITAANSKYRYGEPYMTSIF